MLDVIVSSPMFGFGLSIICFELAVFIQQKVKSPIANPMLISGVLIIVLLSLSGISFEQYNNGARFITMFISPCTALLVVNIYNNLDTVKKYLIPILAGTAAAAAASMGSVYVMCKLLGLNEEMLFSLLPKSATTAISMPLTSMTGGIDAILVAATMITGTLCAIIAPLLTKLFRFKDPVAVGIAIGASGHGVGTSTAVKMGPVQGATAGIAIAMTGLFTVLFYSILFTV